MSDPSMPAIGMHAWGDDLNAYLAWLEDRLTAVEARAEYIYNSSPWQFSNAAPPATGNQVRLNNAQGALATVADFRRIDSDGADRTPWFQLANVGSLIRLQDWDNASVFYRYHVTGPATFDATNAQVPISWESGSGVLPNAKINVGFIVVLTL